jgi:hypothetical protein
VLKLLELSRSKLRNAATVYVPTGAELRSDTLALGLLIPPRTLLRVFVLLKTFVPLVSVALKKVFVIASDAVRVAPTATALPGVGLLGVRVTPVSAAVVPSTKALFG